MRTTTFQRLISMSLVLTTILSTTSAAVTRIGRVDGLTLEREDLDLLSRDDANQGCSSLGLSSDYTSCGQGLPSNFCCNAKAGFTCNAFNNNQSALCCPQGTDCTKFSQIPCNPQGLNVTAPGSANASIHSTQVVGGLVICSDLCCPTGYTCSSDGSKTCILNDGSGSSTSSSPAATLSNAPSATSGVGSSGMSPDQVKGSGGTSTSNQCPPYPAPAVLVGFFPGMVGGIFAAVAAILCLGSRNRKREEQQQVHVLRQGIGKGPKGSSIASSSRPSIDPARPPPPGLVSEPILTGATRTEFLRRKTLSNRSPSQRSARVRSLFSGASRRAEMANAPKTPAMSESGTEMITVFSPEASMRGGPTAASGPGSTGTRETQWEDVMNGGGAKGLGFRELAAPPAFLGSPRVVDPRSRGLDGSANIRR